jgi:phosphoribosyl-ATP pyrophosphohydrolase/phosphoribosyl-AMP cyclohydrolase
MIEDLKFDENGLIPAVVQDYKSRTVLMVAYMNQESLQKTLETGRTVFYSRSRRQLWQKGETSGHVQRVKEIRVDCDRDTLLILVEQEGPACHTNHYSCFYTNLQSGAEVAAEPLNISILNEVLATIQERVKHPVEGSYTNYLFEKGLDKMLKKVGEEAAETIIAAKNRSYDEVRYEVADLMYHISVVLVEQGLTWDDIFAELSGRRQ